MNQSPALSLVSAIVVLFVVCCAGLRPLCTYQSGRASFDRVSSRFMSFPTFEDSCSPFACYFTASRTVGTNVTLDPLLHHRYLRFRCVLRGCGDLACWPQNGAAIDARQRYRSGRAHPGGGGPNDCESQSLQVLRRISLDLVLDGISIEPFDGVVVKIPAVLKYNQYFFKVDQQYCSFVCTARRDPVPCEGFRSMLVISSYAATVDVNRQPCW